MSDDAAIRGRIVALLSKRAAASICPSEVARDLFDDEAAWRAAMPSVRRVAASMTEAGELVVTQRDRTLPSSDVLMAAGPIRLRRGPRFPLDA